MSISITCSRHGFMNCHRCGPTPDTSTFTVTETPHELADLRTRLAAAEVEATRWQTDYVAERKVREAAEQRATEAEGQLSLAIANKTTLATNYACAQTALATERERANVAEARALHAEAMWHVWMQGGKRAEAREDELETALRVMAHHWDETNDSHLTLPRYVHHADGCGGGDHACPCGLNQSLATFKKGRTAIDAALSPAREPETVVASCTCPRPGALQIECEQYYRCYCACHPAREPEPAEPERRGALINPFKPDNPATCEHRWEPHIWEPGKRYCPYCATTEGAPTREPGPPEPSAVQGTDKLATNSDKRAIDEAALRLARLEKVGEAARAAVKTCVCNAVWAHSHTVECYQLREELELLEMRDALAALDGESKEPTP